MSQSLFSPSWYRVADLKPRLRSHLEIHRHHYRGELWYVLQDHASGRFQRFTPSAYLLIGLMDGRHSVQELWEVGRARLGENAPTQEEVIRLLSQLHAVNALQTDVVPDTAEMLKRFEKQRYGKIKQNMRSPLFMRFSLLDPERILNLFLPLVRPVFGWFGAIIWLAVVGYGVYLAGLHWSQLTENITDRVLAPSNLVILWLTFPFLKAFTNSAMPSQSRYAAGKCTRWGSCCWCSTRFPTWTLRRRRLFATGGRGRWWGLPG